MKIWLLLYCVLASLGFAQSAAIERGKNDFFYYCSGCHSLTLVASDLLTEQYPAPAPWKDALVNGKWVSLLTPEDAEAWFGRLPPDLSLITLSHSRSWVSEYLQSFYLDPKQEWGCNNALLPQLKMPDVLNGELRRAQIANDIASFLSYAAEPSADRRKMIGAGVFVFCIFGFILARMLKKAYKV